MADKFHLSVSASDLNAAISKANAAAPQSTTYTKSETDERITAKVAEIVADAPEDFDTLKEMSDWISQHEDSAAAMNSAITANTAAISGKVDKVSGKQLSTNDYTTAEKTKLAGLENYDDTAVKSGIALNRQTLGSTSKNLLKITAVSQTDNGVTFTVNADGSITANGTATKDTYLIQPVVLPIGSYTYSTGVNSSPTTYDSYLYDTENSVAIARDSSISPGQTFILTDNKTLSLRFRVRKGYTANKLTFYPMLRSADIEDDTFEPYRPSLQTQIGKLVDGGAKNLLKITAASRTINGVTFTVNADGSITANGTANDDSPFIISESLDTQDGSFVLSVKGTSPGNIGTWFMDTYEVGWTNRRTFTAALATVPNTKILRLVIAAGYTANNLTIYPMLCTAEDYEASQEFVPYCPTMQELYQRILALENNS